VSEKEYSVKVQLEGELVMRLTPLDKVEHPYSLSLVMEQFKRPSVYFTTQGKAMKVGEMGRREGCWSKVEITMPKTHDKENDSPKE
jgi:hypothetical protein